MAIYNTNMTRARRGGGPLDRLPVVLALLLCGCSLDFNEAIPCRGDQNCPSDMVCNLEIGRCEPGVPSTDDAETDAEPDQADDATDLVQEDPTVDPTVDEDPDLPQDSPPEDPDAAEDAEEDPEPDPIEDPVEEPDSDACVPSTEVCNGEDDDCDGTPDNGITCCPDADHMVVISRAITGTYCVDIYEASRFDATLNSPGTVEDQGAFSLPGKKPWQGATQQQASDACTTAGKRLCTTDEWTEACGGPEGNLYPYSPTTYDGSLCNGVDAGVGSTVPTGARLGCESPDGSFDMSGNLQEWVEDNGSTRGGSYEDGNVILRCTGLGESVDPTSSDPSVGFRCCADTLDSAE